MNLRNDLQTALKNALGWNQPKLRDTNYIRTRGTSAFIKMLHHLTKEQKLELLRSDTTDSDLKKRIDDISDDRVRILWDATYFYDSE